MSSDSIREKHKKYLWPAVANYYQQPLVADRGQMQYLWDLDGRRYLDFFGGILTISVGHCNPKVTGKIKAQVDKLQHTSTLYPNEAIVALAEKLAGYSPLALALAKEGFMTVQDMEYGKSLHYLRELSAIVALSDDAKEGIAAFFEKRPPRWTGR